MEASKLSLALALTLICSLSVSHAQDSPQDFLDAHNAARAGVGVAPLAWDETVAGYARDYASQRVANCDMVHSDGPYGENIAWSSGDMAGTEAVNMWVGENVYYDINSNTCAAGETCGHYTQVVWSGSVRVGCAKVTCDSGGTFIGCNYDPPGNYVGQKPY